MGWLRHRNLSSAIGIALGLALSGPALGATSKELKRIESEKRNATKELSRSRQRLDEVQSALKDVEVDIAGLSQSARENSHQLQELSKTLEVLEQDVVQHERKINQGRHLVADDLRNLQTLQYERAPLKALLGGAEIASVSRYTAYQRYFIRAHQERVATLHSASTALEQGRAKVHAKQQELESVALRLGEKQAQLQERAAEQQRLVALTNQEIGTKQSRLKELEENEKRLKETLRRLALQHSKTRPPKESRNPIRGGLADRKGRLSPPVTGTGRSVAGRGVLIEAREGDAVRAVAGGKVAFADWMRGYGLLLIIDHGSGFMSLYGHNQSLLKAEGDTVTAGDSIANVGNTGGQSQPGVYFELRHDGQPLDPLKWLQGFATR